MLCISTSKRLHIKMLKNIISTSQRCAKHLFAGQNKQQENIILLHIYFFFFYPILLFMVITQIHKLIWLYNKLSCCRAIISDLMFSMVLHGNVSLRTFVKVLSTCAGKCQPDCNITLHCVCNDNQCLFFLVGPKRRFTVPILHSMRAWLLVVECKIVPLDFGG